MVTVVFAAVAPNVFTDKETFELLPAARVTLVGVTVHVPPAAPFAIAQVIETAPA
jgi:hypothetical protein